MHHWAKCGFDFVLLISVFYPDLQIQNTIARHTMSRQYTMSRQ